MPAELPTPDMGAPEDAPDPGIALRRALSQPPGGDGEVVCDFCRMPIPRRPVTAAVGGEEYTFCTAACRDELVETDSVFTEYHGFRRTDLGVAALDRYLPQGIPRNSFVLLSGEPGTRKDSVGIELVWRALQRGEPAAMITFTEPPISLVQRFLDMRWNVLPALEDDRLALVDCFTTRIDHPERFRRRLNRWNRHISRVVDPRTATVDDPGDPPEIRNKIENVTERLGMIDRGIVHLDSLTEFGTLVQPIRAYRFVKDIRADVAKGRFVPVFAGATITTDVDVFPHDLAYMVDGIVDLQLDGSIVKDTLIRRIRVRKMNGVLAITEWKAFEFTSDRGMVPFDPRDEIAKHGGTPTPPPPEDEHS